MQTHRQMAETGVPIMRDIMIWQGASATGRTEEETGNRCVPRKGKSRGIWWLDGEWQLLEISREVEDMGEVRM